MRSEGRSWACTHTSSVRHHTGHAAGMPATDWTLCSARLGSYLCRVRMDTAHGDGASVLVSIPV